MTTGGLLLRGADEPFALSSPTTLTGTNDLGALSNVVLDTPAVTFVQDVPQYGTTATITAVFSMVEPGTGFLNEQGNMTVQLRVAVDLHIVTPLLPDPSDCRAAPIALTLTSVAPYDGERVTLRAPNFSVPEIPLTPTCGLVQEAVNNALKGAGHSFTLALAGAITPPPEGEPTATTLAVDPAAGSRLGDEVTLTATVAPAPAVPGAPPVSGVVSFYDGDTAIGTAPVEGDGTATFTTTTLGAGPRQLRAEYGGAPPDWDPSETDPLPYTVTTDPAVTTSAAGEVRIGGPGKDFDVTVINTGFGAQLDDARLEVTIARQFGFDPIGPNGSTPRITLHRVNGATTTPVELTPGAGFVPPLIGTVGDAGPWLVAPGDEHTEDLRLTVANGTVVGPLSLTFALVTGQGVGKVTLGSATGTITMVNDARQATTIRSGFPGFPPFFPDGVPITPTVRQGNVAELEYMHVIPAVGGVSPTGTYTVTIDGVPMQIQHTNLDLPEAFLWTNRAPVTPSFGTASARYLVRVPSTTPTGTRQVTVRYSGDALYAPTQQTWPITVEQGIGTVYECLDASVVPKQFTVNMEVQAALSTMWPAGRDMPVDRVQVTLRLSRTAAQEQILAGTNEEDPVWQLDLGPAGTITMSGVTGTNASPPPIEGDANGPDHTITLTGGTGIIPVSSTPGDVTYTLDRIHVTAIVSGFTAGFTCTPGDEPYEVGTVTAAGTTLVADPGVVVGEGNPVVLTATTHPAAAGVVEFRDGTQTIGVVPVGDSGLARMTTSSLPTGTRSLTARFFGALAVTASPSAPVALHVGVCGSTSAPGNAAVVRLVYLELLGRCPDAAGAAHWVGRLDGGTSQEAFARSIARTPEAVGRVVDDAYQTMLGRSADASGRAFWTGRLSASGRYDRLLADLGASDELWSQAGSTNEGFVTRVYDRLLHRAPDAAGLAYWTGRLDDGTSRKALVLTLANLDEPLGVLVTGSYQEILARTPDGTERTAGIGHLRSTGDRSGLYAQLIGLPEFSERAQGLPNPA